MPRTLAEPQLQRMVDALRHESFYKAGTWIDEALGVYVGWVAAENSFSDDMPLINEKGDLCLVFSGEEFPEPDTTSRLRQNGHHLDSNGPSYLVHLCEEDPTFPANLNGRFHGLLVDRTRGTATLFNDRFGMHRICYYESKDAVYFAAEAKAILAVGGPELRKVDPRSVGEFVACGYILENRTLFEHIPLLPPASAWVFRNGELERKERYFQPREWEEQAPLEPETYYEQIRETFARTLPRYCNGRERIGMSLTGGLDTRAVMAWQKLQPGDLPCYTFGGMFRECRDVILARRVASLCGQTHDVIPVGEDFLSKFSHYAERTVYLSDGCVDVSRSADLYANERARKIAPVRMTGLYGDEVLRHLRTFKPIEPAAGLFQREMIGFIDRARQTYVDLLRAHPLSFAVFHQAPWTQSGSLALEQTQVAMRTPFLDNDFVRTVFRAPKSASANNDLRARLIQDGNPVMGQLRTDLGFGGESDNLTAAANRLLLKFTFKAEYGYDYGMPQWVARVDHAFSSLHLEHLFLGRHKFYHFRVWYRDALAKYVREILLDPRALARPYVERRTLEGIVRGHLKGDHNYTTSIHKLLTLELMHRRFIDTQ
jgi:asparagine synthase (glutamine-hydrolysing)